MKIFLCSTSYDLTDFRSLVVNRLESRGHEVLFHESTTFPARIGLHSHDQCLEAIKGTDLVICLVDTRYGGKYHGSILNPFTPLEFNILGSTKNGSKKRYDLCYELSALSITWCEVYTAHDEGIPVITFARQRTLDEKETRRRNQFLSSFQPAHVDKNELFDFLDWITQRKTNNWIAPFVNIVDFEKKLSSWMNEVDKSIPKPKVVTEEDIGKSRVCIIVEGEVDRLFVSHLINILNLTQHFVIIPSYGKYQVLNNFEAVVAQYAKIFEWVIVLLDSDAYTEEEYRGNSDQLENIIHKSGRENILGFFAHPNIESWLIAGLNPDLYMQRNGVVDKKDFKEIYGTPSINHIRNLLVHKFSFDSAMSTNHEFHNFVEKLMGLGYKQENG